jgi:hypothetical protein
MRLEPADVADPPDVVAGTVGLAIGPSHFSADQEGIEIACSVVRLSPSGKASQPAFPVVTVMLLITDVAIVGLTRCSSGEHQTEVSAPNGRNLSPTIDPVGSIRLILSTSMNIPLKPGALVSFTATLDKLLKPCQNTSQV